MAPQPESAPEYVPNAAEGLQAVPGVVVDGGVSGPYGSTRYPYSSYPTRTKTICGLRQPTFWLTTIILVLVTLGAVGGGVGGSIACRPCSQGQSQSQSQTQSISNPPFILATTVASCATTSTSTVTTTQTGCATAPALTVTTTRTGCATTSTSTVTTTQTGCASLTYDASASKGKYTCQCLTTSKSDNTGSTAAVCKMVSGSGDPNLNSTIVKNPVCKHSGASFLADVEGQREW